MSCIVLVGGGIGCGKSTLINFILKNENILHELNSTLPNSSEVGKDGSPVNCCFIEFDNLCPIEEQGHLMNSVKAMRDFRTDLRMAAERFITLSCNSQDSTAGPLTERSYNLLEKLKASNDWYNNTSSNNIIFVEDNFYYRSMRYDWFQLARRTNLGFAIIFLHCPISLAIQRNSSRGYQLPEERLKKLLTLMALPDPKKFKWERMFVNIDSSPPLTDLDLTDTVNVIKDAMKNPVQSVILQEKFEAQQICSKNVMHQSDKILRKLVSSTILHLRNSHIGDDKSLKIFVSYLVRTRQKLLSDITLGVVNLPEDLVDKIQTLGIESVMTDYRERLTELFAITLKDLSLELSTLFENV